MNYGEAIAYFKSVKQIDKVIALFGNQPLIEALLAWKSIQIRFKESGLTYEGLSDTELWDKLWENVEFSKERWAVIAGIKPQLANNIFERLRGYRLIFPDGTIDVIANQYVNSIIIDKLGLNTPKESHDKKTKE